MKQDTTNQKHNPTSQNNNSTNFPNGKPLNVKAIVLGSLACIILLFLLSVLYPAG